MIGVYDDYWWKKAVIYQIYPRSFKDSNGDGIGDITWNLREVRLSKNLGIDAIWLSPVYQSPMVDKVMMWGIIVKSTQFLERYQILISLSISQKKLGIRLIMDMVVNHTSDQHAWFQESCKSKHNSKRNFYIWRDQLSEILVTGPMIRRPISIITISLVPSNLILTGKIKKFVSKFIR